ncbi:MAG TPA: hypothetical protein VHZ03_01980 [Trebonia sp.]|nr:hypothetical protein [Trebonia sp.]
MPTSPAIALGYQNFPMTGFGAPGSPLPPQAVISSGAQHHGHVHGLGELPHPRSRKRAARQPGEQVSGAGLAATVPALVLRATGKVQPPRVDLHQQRRKRTWVGLLDTLPPPASRTLKHHVQLRANEVLPINRRQGREPDQPGN